MPNFMRWIFAFFSSVLVAGLIFLLATVGIVVAFFVFIALFIFINIAMRRARRQGGGAGQGASRIVVFTNLPGGGGMGAGGASPDPHGISEAGACSSGAERVHTPGGDGEIYDLSPEDYKVEYPDDASTERKK